MDERRLLELKDRLEADREVYAEVLKRIKGGVTSETPFADIMLHVVARMSIMQTELMIMMVEEQFKTRVEIEEMRSLL